MKTWKKVSAALLAAALSLSMTACGTATTSSTTSSEAAPASSKAEESSAASEVKSGAESKVESQAEPVATGDGLDTPRNETLYFGGIQWGKPINANPLSPKPNFGAVEQNDQARVLIYETLYMYNQSNGKVYPLLADGDYTWNADRTVITVKIKADAKWNDGTALTAHDVVATWDAHKKYQSPIGVDYATYIESITAKDDATVEIKAVSGDNYNPLKVTEYLPKAFVMQKAYLEELDKKNAGDPTAMKNETMFDAPHSGPYTPVLYDSEQKWVLQREDGYWGQADSMWGSLPAPKYVAHNIFADNNATAVAFRNGEIDVNQQFLANIQDLWEKEGLPVSTYLEEAPYQQCVSLPTAWFNTTVPGLDQKAVRKAIAIAVDYDQINTASMTGQSPSFKDVPRSLFNPTEAEQAMIQDPAALADYQFMGKDIEGAKKLLDEANIVDTDGDGIREYPAGTNLAFKLECPNGWSDWNSALEIVAAAGKEIGIDLETYFPEAATYTEDIQTGNFQIAMATMAGASIANPWTRAYQTMYGFGGEFPGTMTFAYSRWYNARAEELLKLISTESDEAKVKEYYQELNILYLDEVPSFTLMYRPGQFHEVFEGVWTGFPAKDDGTDVPPQLCCNGYGIAALYNLTLIEG